MNASREKLFGLMGDAMNKIKALAEDYGKRHDGGDGFGGAIDGNP